jgi:hypothetical protein
MRYLKIIACLLLLSFTAKAQVVNILEEIGINDINLQLWVEKGKYYYCMRTNDTLLTLNRYDKYTLEESGSVLLFTRPSGDTTNYTNAEARFCITPDDRLHIFYRRPLLPGETPPTTPGIYYRQLNLSLAEVVPDKRLDMQGSFQSMAAMHNGGVLYATLIGAEPKGLLHVIDKSGDIIKQDTAAIANYPGMQNVVEVMPYINNQYVVTGKRLTRSASFYDFFIADSMLQVVDTFMPGPGTSGYPGYSPVQPNMAVLPSGSLVLGRSGCTNGFGAFKQLFTKHFATTRFTVENDFLQETDGIDSEDFCHLRGNIDVMDYNPFDHSVYLISATHNNNSALGGGCNDPRYAELVFYTKRYAEVTCVDTNLNLKWRKYIRFDFEEGHCVIVGKKVVVPDNREGILFTGQLFKWMGGTDTLRQFVYHITEGTATDSTIFGEPTSINSPGIEIRNRVKLYPNPALDLIHVNDIKEELVSVCIVDMYGRKILEKTCKGSDADIDISTLPPGIYLARVQLSDGAVELFKFSKR